MPTIDSVEQLRAIYAQPGVRALKKQLAALWLPNRKRRCSSVTARSCTDVLSVR